MMYVRINQNMMRKRQRIGYSVDVAHASDLLPDAEDDEQPAVPSAWREVEEEAEEAFAAEAEERTTRSVARATRVAAAKDRRRKPAAADEPSAAQQATRTGRNVRRPAVFDL